MKETTLVHIMKDDCVLMMHRISKKQDINYGKWIGVGGKLEWGETPEECMRREVREETGLLVDRYRYCGIVTFVSDEDETEYMHLFTVTGFHDRNGNYVREAGQGGMNASAAAVEEGSARRVSSTAAKEEFVRRVSSSAAEEGIRPCEMSGIELKKCNEGTLEWLPKKMLTKIPHWAGDRIFLPLILDTVIPFFSMKLVYRKGDLIHASLNEHNCLVTDRLVLRPWMEDDAAALYRWAKNPNIGPRAGWLPLRDVAESRKVLRDVLMRPEIYAIVLRDTAEPVGSVGLKNFRLTDYDGTLLTYFDERQSIDPLVCTKPDSDEQSTEPSASIKPGPDEQSIEPSACTKPDSDGQSIDPLVCTNPDSNEQDEYRIEAELGYWLAEPFWHRGFMTEAAGAVLEHARTDLGISRMWVDYYDGNDPSRRVIERLGYIFHHTETDRYVAAMDERRTAHVYVKDLA